MLCRGSQALSITYAVYAPCEQAVPTHQVLQSNDVMEALLRLLQSDRPAVVEHAASVFSVLANNPSTHFQVCTCACCAFPGMQVGGWVLWLVE